MPAIQSWGRQDVVEYHVPRNLVGLTWPQPTQTAPWVLDGLRYLYQDFIQRRGVR